MNLSQITQSLYIGTTPRVKDYDLLVSLDIDLVINMRFGIPPVRELFMPPLKSLWLPTIDSPLFPIPIRMLVKGAHAALEVIQQGRVVLVHCTKGRHRGVAMGACVLIAQGMPSEEAMRLIEEKRAVADPYAWYIQRRIRKFESEWKGQETG